MVVPTKVGIYAVIVVELRRELGAGETVGVKRVRVWIVVLLGDGVVNGQHISLDGTLNCDTNHCFELEQGAVLVLVRVLVEVDTGEEGEPRTGV